MAFCAIQVDAKFYLHFPKFYMSEHENKRTADLWLIVSASNPDWVYLLRFFWTPNPDWVYLWKHAIPQEPGVPTPAVDVSFNASSHVISSFQNKKETQPTSSGFSFCPFVCIGFT